MKQIQEEKIGHVPRKYSDKIWAEFKTACAYFDKLKSTKARIMLKWSFEKESLLEE
jgi:hypothetical protein